MESTRQKTFALLRTQLSVAVVLAFILLICAALSLAGQYKVVLVSDADTIKVLNNDRASTIRLVGINAPETSKNKNQPGQSFSQNCKKNLAKLVLNMSVKKNCYGDDRYNRIIRVVYVECINVNLEMDNAGLAEFYRE